MNARTREDYRAVVAELRNSDDAELEKFGVAVKGLLDDERFVLPTISFTELAQDVTELFPVPFVKTFEVWRTGTRVAFQRAIEDGSGDLNTSFRSSFDSIWSCWKQIVRFLPFVLLAPLSRPREDLAKRAGKRLSRAVSCYQDFYQLPEGEKEAGRIRYETQQCLLLEQLVELCVEFGNASEADGTFFFTALSNGFEDFREIFPARFTLELWFLQKARNRIEHGELWMRAPQFLKPIAELVETVFLDVLAIITPLCRAYGLFYVERIEDEPVGLTAYTWPFDASCVAPARFRLQKDGPGQPSVYKFVPKHIYFIDRKKELSRDPVARALVPRDYVDLTPFIIDKGRVDAATVAGERGLYALSEYSSEDRSRFVRFLELAGSALRRLPAREPPSDQELREANDLLKDLDTFTKFVQGLSAAKVSRRRTGTDCATLRRYLWDRVSKQSLASVIDVRQFEYDGDRAGADGGGSSALTSYDPELYLAPAQAQDLGTFFASKQRGMLLIGGSGYGKTTLLASSFLERLRAGDVAVFLSGRSRAESTLPAILNAVAADVGHEWTFADLERFVRDENDARARAGRQGPTQVTLFIDAINEFTSGGGAQQLLGELIALVNTGGDAMFGRRLESLRIVATCRTETWRGYTGGRTVALDAFCRAADGEPVTVGGFDDNAMRRALFEKYRTRYSLQSTNYDRLPAAVTDLFRSPLILALVAETYGSREPGCAGERIPKQLNYFKVFVALKQRKLEDAKKLVPTGAERIFSMGADLNRCLQAFATLLYARLTSEEDSPRDYVGVEETTRPPMHQYTIDRNDHQITTFRALREINLITSKIVAECDWTGLEIEGEAYTFFHDRYAEFELAGIYMRELGVLSPALVRNEAALQQVVARVEKLLRRAVNFPVLSGALDHWFQANLNVKESKGDVAVLIPLCNRMALSESGSVRSKASDVLAGFVLRGLVAAPELFEKISANGVPSLQIDVAIALGQSWPEISSESIRSFLEVCDPKRDALVVEALADVFAEHANLERLGGDGATSVAFVADVCPDRLGLFFRLRHPNRVKTHLKFLVRFSQVTIVTCEQRPEILKELQSVLVGRFGFLVDILLGSGRGKFLGNWITKKLQGLLREQLEDSIYAAWETGISTGGVNDTFFVADRGLVQREVLFEFLPYMCAVHNRAYELLSMEDGSRFRELLLVMLNYRKYSIIGSAGYWSVTIAFRGDQAVMLKFLSKLMSEGTDAGRFVAVNILETFCQIYPAFARDGLRFVREEMLPELLDEGLALPHLLICAAGIVETDVESNWEYLVPSLDVAFKHLEGDAEKMLEFGKEMRCMMFFAEKRIGTKFIEYLFKAGHLTEGSEWRAAALQICAGMLIGRREELLNLIGESMCREVEPLRTQEVLDQERTFGTRARWNLFLVRIFAFNTKFRYLVMKYMLGPFALCNKVPEWAHQMGTFLLEAIRAYSIADVDSGQYDHLTVKDFYEATPMRPREGAGEVYVPRTGRS